MSRVTPLTMAWLFLVAMSALSALLASGLLPISAKLSGSALLLLASLKARTILLDYLALRLAPSWRRGFIFVLYCFVAVLVGLFLAA